MSRIEMLKFQHKNLKKQAITAGYLFAANYLGARRPLIVSWAITGRCNLRCKYCDASRYKSNELTLKKSLSLIEQMAKAGTHWLHFTGGEPLLYPFIGELLIEARRLDIFTTVGTNGVLVPEKLKELSYAGALNISLDGRTKAHEITRGRGSFASAMAAAESAFANKIPLRFSCVLTKSNLNAEDLDFLFETAQKYKTVVTFQPPHLKKLWSGRENPTLPETAKYRNAIDYLIESKKLGKKIGNSIPGLRYLRNWPNTTPIRCVAALIFCRITPTGELIACPRNESNLSSRISAVDIGFEQAFKLLKSDSCSNCWAAAMVEASLILEMNPRAIKDSLFHKLGLFAEK